MARNDITLDSIRTKGPSEAYDSGYDRIFGKRTVFRCVASGCDGCLVCEPDKAVQDDAVQLGTETNRLHP